MEFSPPETNREYRPEQLPLVDLTPQGDDDIFNDVSVAAVLMVTPPQASIAPAVYCVEVSPIESTWAQSNIEVRSDSRRASVMPAVYMRTPRHEIDDVDDRSISGVRDVFPPCSAIVPAVYVCTPRHEVDTARDVDDCSISGVRDVSPPSNFVMPAVYTWTPPTVTDSRNVNIGCGRTDYSLPSGLLLLSPANFMARRERQLKLSRASWWTNACD